MLQQMDSDFIRGIPEDLVAMLETIAEEEHAGPGARMFHEGGPHSGFHIILDGHVRLDMHVPGRGRIPILTLGPGDILAWSALLSDGTMTAGATALDSVRTASLPGDKLRELCDAQPILGYHVMKQLAIALSKRLLATRLQLLDLFAEQQPAAESPAPTNTPVDAEC